MNAEFLSQFTYEMPPDEPLKRSLQIQAAYNQFSVTEGPKVFIATIQDVLKTKKYIIMENMFPYDVEPPIQHKCIWYKGQMGKNEIEKILDGEGMTYITYFENPYNLKSIKEVGHYHLFHY